MISLRYCAVLMFMAAALMPAQAQDTGMSFLRMGTFAEHAGLGDTYTAYVHGAASLYGNPAGLAVQGQNSGALSYQSWIAATSIYSAAARFRAGQQGGVGLSIAVFDGGDLEARDRPGPGEPFAAQFLAASAGYARQIGPLRAGIVGKILSERIYTENASGYALDAGLQASFFQDYLMLGASIHNLGAMQELGAEATDLPTMIRVGAAGYPVRIYSGNDGEPTFRFFLSPEIVLFPDDDVQQFRVGAGAEVSDLLSVRTGYISGDDVRQFTFGAGVFYAGFQFDYAFLPLEEGFGGPSHMLTLTYGW